MLTIKVEFLDSTIRTFVVNDRDSFDISDNDLTLYDNKGRISDYINLKATKQIFFVDN